MKKTIYLFKETALFLSKNIIFCILIILFSLILIFSTIIQKEINIDSACQKYIFANVIWVIDFFPIPGGKIILILIYMSLIIRVISEKFYLKKFGTFLIHLGIIILLSGSIITYLYSEEGILKLKQEKNEIFLKLKNKYKININNEFANKEFLINKNKIFDLKDFKLKIIDIYNNSEISHKEFPINEENKNLINYFNIKEIPMFIEKKKNKIILLISILNGNKNIFIYLDKNKKKHIKINNIIYTISFGNYIKKLPFSLKLMEAKKINYLNSNQAKLYKSKLLIKDKDINWFYNIEMNKPLRYKNYTFYQTSFIEDLSGKKIILTVTKDYGKLFPYISCFIIFLGFIIHLFKILKIKSNYYENC